MRRMATKSKTSTFPHHLLTPSANIILVTPVMKRSVPGIS